jgi:hypothetical protein
MEGIEVEQSNNGDDQQQQQAAANSGRRFYVCHRRQSDEGCTFVKPSNEFTRLINDDRLEELDLHDESLQDYVDQNLVEDDDNGSVYDDEFSANNDNDDEDDGCGLVIEDFYHEDGTESGLHLEDGEVESPLGVVVLITDEGDRPAADSDDAALRHHSEERRLDEEEDESQGSPLEVELNEGGSEGIS